MAPSLLFHNHSLPGAPVQSANDAELQVDHQSIHSLLRQTLSQDKSLWKTFAVQPHRREDAQTLIDFLSQVLRNESSVKPDEARRILSLIRTIAKTANIFPTDCKLDGVECDLNSPLEEGGFAFICKGTYRSHAVCVKAIRIAQKKKDSGLRVQSKELALWAHLSHPNILQFYGVYVPSPNHPRTCIVTRWMPEGDLKSYLGEHPGLLLNTRKLFLLDVIAGLVYLHDHGIIHADLKAANILISESGHAVIADFGISLINSGFSTTNPLVKGTQHWTAPELVFEHQKKPSEESDIWSFGCLGFEVLTEQMPYQHCQQSLALLLALKNWESPLENLDSEVLQLILDSGMQSLLKRCWNFESSSRPTSQAILHEMQRMDIPDTRQPNIPEDLVLRQIQMARSRVRINHQSVICILQRLLQQSGGISSEHAVDQSIPSEPMGIAAHTAGNTLARSSNSGRPSFVPPLPPPPPPLPTSNLNPVLAPASMSTPTTHNYAQSLASPLAEETLISEFTSMNVAAGRQSSTSTSSSPLTKLSGSPPQPQPLPRAEEASDSPSPTLMPLPLPFENPPSINHPMNPLRDVPAPRPTVILSPPFAAGAPLPHSPSILAESVLSPSNNNTGLPGTPPSRSRLFSGFDNGAPHEPSMSAWPFSGSPWLEGKRLVDSPRSSLPPLPEHQQPGLPPRVDARRQGVASTPGYAGNGIQSLESLRERGYYELWQNSGDPRYHHRSTVPDNTILQTGTSNAPRGPSFPTADPAPRPINLSINASDAHYRQHGNANHPSAPYRNQTQWSPNSSMTLPTAYPSAHQHPYQTHSSATNISLSSPPMPVPSPLPRNQRGQQQIPYVDHNVTAQPRHPAELSPAHFVGGFPAHVLR